MISSVGLRPTVYFGLKQFNANQEAAMAVQRWAHILERMQSKGGTEIPASEIELAAYHLKRSCSKQSNHILLSQKLAKEKILAQNPFGNMTTEGQTVVERLPERQLQILELAALGFNYAQIGERLGSTRKTVANHANRMHLQFDLPKTSMIMAKAVELGIIRSYVPGPKISKDMLLGRLEQLSLRELEVLSQILGGKTLKEVAFEFDIKGKATIYRVFYKVLGDNQTPDVSRVLNLVNATLKQDDAEPMIQRLIALRRSTLVQNSPRGTFCR